MYQTKHNNGLNKINIYVCLHSSQAWAVPGWDVTPGCVGPWLLPPGCCTDKMEPCPCSSWWEEGVLAAGGRRAQSLLVKATSRGWCQPVLLPSYCSTGSHPATWSCEGAGKCGLCPGSQVPSETWEFCYYIERESRHRVLQWPLLQPV